MQRSTSREANLQIPLHKVTGNVSTFNMSIQQLMDQYAAKHTETVTQTASTSATPRSQGNFVSSNSKTSVIQTPSGKKINNRRSKEIMSEAKRSEHKVSSRNSG